MMDLFLFEFKRYHKYALMLLVALLAVFAYAYMVSPLSVVQGETNAKLILLTLLFSIVFGIYQLVVHRKKSHWTYLIHRPLAPKTIYHSLIAAGGLLVAIVTFLPLFTAFMVIDIAGTETIEIRHYLYCLHLFMIAMVTYLTGIYAVLNASWGAIFALALLPFMLSNTPVSPIVLFTTDSVCLLVIYYLSYRSFKVNLSVHFSQKRDLFLASLIMQPVIAVLLFMTQAIYYHFPLFIFDAHPDRYEYNNGEHDRSYSALWHWDNAELIDKVVEQTTYPDKATLIEQVNLATEFAIDAKPIKIQRLGQLPHQDKTAAMVDNTNKVNWVFSHTDGVFVGRDLYTKAVTGYLGKDGFYATKDQFAAENAQFTQVPRTINNQFIQTRDAIYRVDFSGQYVDLKNQLSKEGEFFTTQLQILSKSTTAVILTNKSMQFFDLNLLNEDSSYTEPDLVVPNYREFFTTQRTSIFELVDGYLIHYYSPSLFAFEQPATSIVYAKFDGSTQLLGEYHFDNYRPLPQWIINQDFWLSPIVMNMLYDTVTAFRDPANPNEYRTLFNFSEQQYSANFNRYALIAAIFSALLTYLLARRIQLPNSKVWFWTLLNLCFSLPGFIAFVLLNRWRGKLLVNASLPKNSDAKVKVKKTMA